MAKIKYTKGELKRQRDALSQFRRYLPTLQLKKQQLQMKVLEIRNKLQQKQHQLTEKEHDILQWVGLLGDPVLDFFVETTRRDVSTSESRASLPTDSGEAGFDIKKYVLPVDIKTEQENIAGAYIPALKDVIFAELDFDVYETPFWADRAIAALRELTRLDVEVQIIEEGVRCLQRELRTTTQRVNLFEKVKIPEAIENIRQITIYLGDQQANAVGISKVAKKKIELAAAMSS